MPDEYDEEQDDESSDSEYVSDEAASSSSESLLVSPAQASNNKSASNPHKLQYPKEEIDRIIREAKEQKKKLLDMAPTSESESESSMSESGFDNRYL